MSAGAVAGAQLAGSTINAYGQLQAAKAKSDTYNFNAGLAEENAEISEQKGAWAAEIGDQDASASQMKTAAKVGSIKANQGASGIEIGTGSNADVVTSAREIGMLDALTIRSNAAREAYGYATEAYNYRMQAGLDEKSAKDAKRAGYIGAGTTLLGSADKGAEYYHYIKNNSVI